MATTKTTGTAKKTSQSGMGSLFDKSNLRWMLIGVVVMAIGFILMAGGKSPNPDVFDKDQVYSPRRITIAPIVILAGLAIEIFAIFYKPKNAKATE
jgi:hypothetical protein